MVVDPKEQASFLAGLRKMAEEASAKNPVLGELRRLGKALVEESRRRMAAGLVMHAIGAYISADERLVLLKPQANDSGEAYSEMVATLTKLVQSSEIRAVGIATLVETNSPLSPVTHVKVRVEHSTGVALMNSMPAKESDLMAGVPGTDGPAVAVYAGKVKPIIFPQRSS